MEISDQVEVYWNINKKCFSVRDTKTNKVILHTDKISLENAKFVVRQGGRNRVLREKQKNVHAFVRGYICTNKFPDGARAATYNPYKHDSFVDITTEQPISEASAVELFTRDGDRGGIKWVK